MGKMTAKKIVFFGLIADIILLFKNEISRDVVLINENNQKLYGEYVNRVLVAGPERICEKIR